MLATLTFLRKGGDLSSKTVLMCGKRAGGHRYQATIYGLVTDGETIRLC